MGSANSLYRLFDASDRLLYIGISNSALARWEAHRKSKPWWPEVANVSVEHFDSRQAAFAAEALAIKEEGPPYNSQRLVAEPVDEAPEEDLRHSIAEFLEDKERKKSPATVDQYRFVLDKVFLPWAAERNLVLPEQITDKQMDAFTEHLKGRSRPLAAETLRTYVRATRVYLTWASVPKGRFEAPGRPRILRNVLSRDEIDRLEAATRDERDKLIVRVLADTGIRVSELTGLRGVDLRENSHDRQYFIKVGGKTGEREVAVPPTLFRRLKAHASQIDAEQFIFEGKRRSSETGAYERLTRSGVAQMLARLARTAKINKRIFPHLFRHSYATMMIRRGVNLIMIQKAMGHSTLAMVSQVYAHTTPGDGYDQIIAALKA